MDNLPDSKTKVYREHFEVFDVNNDGVISIRELGTALRSLGFHMSEKEVDVLYKEVDSNGNGFIDFDEFLNIIMTKMNDPYTHAQLVEALRIFDTDDNGTLNSHDLKSVCMKLGDRMKAADIEEIISEADRDGDGKLSIDDFASMLLSGQKVI